MFDAAAAQAVANDWLRKKLGNMPHAGDPVLDGKVWRVPIHADFPVPKSTDVLPFRNIGELVIETTGDAVGAVGGYPTSAEREARMAEEIGRVLGEIRNEIPEFECERCGKCCGMLGATSMEMHLIDEHIRRHGIEIQEEFMQTKISNIFVIRTTKKGLCPYLQDSECVVYPVRPTICQLFGNVTGHMICAAGRVATTNLTSTEAFGILRRVDVLDTLWAMMCRHQAVVE